MDKEELVYTYNEILLTHKKERIGLSVVVWMKLESVTQNEVSQKEKNENHILTYELGYL